MILAAILLLSSVSSFLLGVLYINRAYRKNSRISHSPVLSFCWVIPFVPIYVGLCLGAHSLGWL